MHRSHGSRTSFELEGDSMVDQLSRSWFDQTRFAWPVHSLSLAHPERASGSRFFTLGTIRELCRGSGLEIETIRRNYRLIEAPHRINRVARLFALPLVREFLTFRYLVRARRRGPHEVAHP